MPELDQVIVAPKGSEWYPKWVWDHVEVHLHNANVMLAPLFGRTNGFLLNDLVGRIRQVERIADVPAGRSGDLSRAAWRVRGLWALNSGDDILRYIDDGDAVLDLQVELVRGLYTKQIERVLGATVYVVPAPLPRVGFLHPDQGEHLT